MSNYNQDTNWVILSEIEQRIKTKVEQRGIPLRDWNLSINRGILTGCNEAFIINEETKNSLLHRDPKSAALIRPILRGRDIFKNSFTFKDFYVITAWFGSHKILENEYPSVYMHLKQFEKQLKNRGQVRYSSSGSAQTNKDYPGQHHWLELDNNPSLEKLEEFKRPKIVFSEMVQTPQFYLDYGNYYVNDTITFITGEKLDVLIRLLNSKLIFNIFKIFYAGGGLGSRGIRMKKTFLLELPLPILGEEFSEIGIDNYEQIDEYLINFYHFTQSEVKVLESNS